MIERNHERPAWQSFRIGIAFVLMALSAVCFLRYAWWAACYSGWYGLPIYAQQLRTASIRASLYLGSVLALQFATFGVLWSLIQLRYTDLSQFLKYGARIGISMATTVAGTGLLIWLLSWIHFFHIR